MHLLVAVHGFPTLQNAGAEKAAERIADWLVKQGHTVEVFALNQLNQPETKIDTQTQNGMTIHRLSLNLHNNDKTFENTYDNPEIGEAFSRILIQGQFDLVHLMSGYLLAGQIIHTAHQYGVPVVLTLTEYFFMCARLNLMHADSSLCTGPETDSKCARCMLEEKRRYSYAARYAPLLAKGYWGLMKNSQIMQQQSAVIQQRRQTLKAAIEAADAVICPSRFIIEKHREYGFDTREFVFIRHGLNRPDGLRGKNTNGKQATLRIGYIGQIKVHKGVDLLVDAVRGMLSAGADVELEIWGRTTDQPDYSRRMMQQTRDYPQVQWKGGFTGGQLWEILAGLDVLVVPSRWYENCPTVILEAYSAGVPVIATNLGGMAELVQPGESGLLFELNRAADLREKLECLLHEPGLLNKLRSGVPYVKSGDEEVSEIYQQYLRVLQQRAKTAGG